jgi:DeoR/GlpR family transcriptional regulator of sugar metabolism
MLRREKGFAIKGVSGSFEPAFAIRSEIAAKAKGDIAKCVANLVNDRETIILDGGSTGVAIAKQLVDRELTICALSFRVADVLRSAPKIQLMVIGGFVRKGEESLVGPIALDTLANYHFDQMIMTASGLDLAQGITEWNSDDAAVKRAAQSASTKTIVAADSSKFGVKAFAKVCNLEEVSLLVTDNGIVKEDLKLYRNIGLDVRVSN